MGNIFTSRDPAVTAAGQLFLGSAVVANLLSECHENGMEAVHRGRERRAAEQYATDLNAARGRADELGRVAIHAVRDIARLEAEVARLKTALDQRQRYIDRMNSRSKAGAS